MSIVRWRGVRLLGVLLFLLVAAGSASAGVVELLANGGFESGFSGWTRLDQDGGTVTAGGPADVNAGGFFVQSGTASPVNLIDVPSPTEGSQAAMTDAAGSGSHVLYQDFLVPSFVLGGSLRFDLFIKNDNLPGFSSFFTPNNLDFAQTNRQGGQNLNQQFRADIMTTSADPFSVAAGDVLQNIYRTNPGDPALSGYTTITSDLSALLLAHQGQTLRLRFAEVDNIFILNAGVDRVRLEAAVPEPGTLAGALVGFTAVAGVMARRRRR